MKNVPLREKVQSLYELINLEFYFARQSLQIREKINEKDGSVTKINYDPVALFGMLTCILEGKEIIFGDYGKGKTTSCERIGSLVYGLPLEFILLSELHCHPEQTEEKMKAILDLGALEKEGREEVIWLCFVYNPVKILDEFNRLIEGKQTELLNEVDRNIWSYRGHSLKVPYGCFCATMNAADRGNTDLLYALKDRCDVSVQVKKPGILRSRKIRRDWNKQDELLSDKNLAYEMIEFLRSKNKSDEKKFEHIIEVSDKFKLELEQRIRAYLGENNPDGALNEDIEKLSIPSFSELEQIRKEIEGMEFEEDVDFVWEYVANEIDFCLYGKKEDFRRCLECHYKNYYCAKMEHGSERLFGGSAPKYTKALAWLLGDEKVTVEHLRVVLPYLLQHRVKLNPHYLEEIDKEKRLNETWSEFLAVEKAVGEMVNEQKKMEELQKEVYNALITGDTNKINESKSKAERNLVEHPVILEMLRDADIEIELP